MFSVLRALGRQLREVVAECNYAQRRAVLRRVRPEYYALEPDQAPDTYEAFLLRAGDPRMRDPSAAQRPHGQLMGCPGCGAARSRLPGVVTACAGGVPCPM